MAVVMVVLLTAEQRGDPFYNTGFGVVIWQSY